MKIRKTKLVRVRSSFANISNNTKRCLKKSWIVAPISDIILNIRMANNPITNMCGFARIGYDASESTEVII